MKRSRLALLIVLITIVFSSCYEITVKTSIHEDGSFTRTVVVQADDLASAYDADLPYPVDDTWETVERYDSTNKDKPYILTYTKSFKSTDELDILIRNDSSAFSGLSRQLDIRKKHRLFFSYLIFEEIIYSANPYTDIAIEDYFSAQEIELIQKSVLLKDDSDSLSYDKAVEKVEKYIEDLMFMEVTKSLEKGINGSATQTLKIEMLNPYEDSIRQHIVQMENGSDSILIDKLAQWSGNEDWLILHEIQPPVFEASDAKKERFFSQIMIEEYEEIVELPGLLTATNSISPVGNTVSWKLDGMAYMVKDYRMFAESRIVNYWGFVITGVVILALIMLLSVRAFKRH
jgi:hypothetical protein